MIFVHNTHSHTHYDVEKKCVYKYISTRWWLFEGSSECHWVSESKSEWYIKNEDLLITQFCLSFSLIYIIIIPIHIIHFFFLFSQSQG